MIWHKRSQLHAMGLPINALTCMCQSDISISKRDKDRVTDIFIIHENREDEPKQMLRNSNLISTIQKKKGKREDNNKKVVGKTTDFKLIFIMEVAMETVMQLRL